MIAEQAVDRLRAKARDWELTSVAAAERGDITLATQATTLAIGFFEMADCLDAEAEMDEEAA